MAEKYYSRVMSTIFAVFFITICYTRTQCLMERNLIWDKVRQNFVDLPNVSQYVQFREEVFDREGVPVASDDSGKVLRVSYYEEKNIIMFYDNDTKVTGICGEIWNLIADMLNITLKPILFKERNFGVHLENGTYSGLLGLLHRNETEVIMRTGYYSARLDMMDYTMPVWETNFQFYIKPKYTFDNKWVKHTFSSQTWCVLIFLFVVLSVSGYVFQNEYYQISKMKKRVKKRGKYFNLTDHLFYTYSTMCNQGHLPNSFYNQNRILSLSKSMFAWLIWISFSSNLIYLMAHRTMTPPFTDFHSLLNETTYEVIMFKGSMIFEFWKASVQYTKKEHQHRFHYMEDPTTMYDVACNGRNQYATLETRDKINSRKKSSCTLTPVGKIYFSTWIGFGIKKSLPYKKNINISILKLYENGLLDALKDRWLGYRTNNKERHGFQAIDMMQVYLIFCVLDIGIALSCTILFIEKLVFFARVKKK